MHLLTPFFTHLSFRWTLPLIIPFYHQFSSIIFKLWFLLSFPPLFTFSWKMIHSFQQSAISRPPCIVFWHQCHYFPVEVQCKMSNWCTINFNPHDRGYYEAVSGGLTGLPTSLHLNRDLHPGTINTLIRHKEQSLLCSRIRSNTQINIIMIIKWIIPYYNKKN